MIRRGVGDTESFYSRHPGKCVALIDVTPEFATRISGAGSTLSFWSPGIPGLRGERRFARDDAPENIRHISRFDSIAVRVI